MNQNPLPPRTVTPARAATIKWLAKCRLDPIKKQQMKEDRRKYYVEHIQDERESALGRYYRAKARMANETPGITEVPGVTILHSVATV